MNPWLSFSLAWLGVWSILYLAYPAQRRRMFWAGLLTAPFGLTEPLFVPAYWKPPSLFDLAANTGFDVESLFFSFAIGGVGVVLYELINQRRSIHMSRRELQSPRHRFHLLALISPVLVFVPLYLFAPINPIYSVAAAMAAGGVATVLCRPDLKGRVAAGGVLFLGLYFASFVLFDLVYPGFVQAVWNLAALSGVLIFGVPLEELLFAFSFGLLWSGAYEHFTWRKITAVRPRP